MKSPIERSLSRWRWIALFAIATSVLLFAALVSAMLLIYRTAYLTEHRLYGTWKFDSQYAIERLELPHDLGVEMALRKRAEHERITYTPTEIITRKDGATQTMQYEVVGRYSTYHRNMLFEGNDRTVVLRSFQKSSPLSLSSRLIDIHFWDQDRYYIDRTDGDYDVFRRVRR